jgi:hypothetical protein
MELASKEGRVEIHQIPMDVPRGMVPFMNRLIDREGVSLLLRDIEVVVRPISLSCWPKDEIVMRGEFAIDRTIVTSLMDPLFVRKWPPSAIAKDGAVGVLLQENDSGEASDWMKKVAEHEFHFMSHRVGSRTICWHPGSIVDRIVQENEIIGCKVHTAEEFPENAWNHSRPNATNGLNMKSEPDSWEFETKPLHEESDPRAKFTYGTDVLRCSKWRREVSCRTARIDVLETTAIPIQIWSVGHATPEEGNVNGSSRIGDTIAGSIS